MNSGQWEKFCVVGLGGHARTKLIPAIEENGQKLAAVVSRQSAPLNRAGTRVFAELADAISELDDDVCFVIASPPAAHFAQALTTLAAGRDTLVEKPAFITVAEARAMADLATATGAVLAEGFMHRHTQLYRRFMADWTPETDTILIDFLIPSVPAGTFRIGHEIAASSLFDMGCYVLSMLADLHIPLAGVEIASVLHAGSSYEQVRLAGGGAVSVGARIGVADTYCNRVTVGRGGEQSSYEPFFYGRPGLRRIVRGGEVTELEEPNAFQAMFAVPRQDWQSRQLERLQDIVAVTASLEALGRDLLDARERNRTP